MDYPVKPEDEIFYFLDPGFPDQVRDRFVQDNEEGMDSPIKSGNDEGRGPGCMICLPRPWDMETTFFRMGVVKHGPE